MTCIIALKDDIHKKIYMGADTLSSDADMRILKRKDNKIFIRHDMIFGFSGSYRTGQVLRYMLDIPERHENVTDVEYLIKAFIPELIETYRVNGVLENKNEILGGEQFLLGYNGNIYKIDSDFQIAQSVDDYDVCGAGESIAIGALFALKNMKLTVKKKINIALSAAGEYHATVGGNFDILELGY